jgi:acyl-coenzyme A synthetase/AMP-(fatty) acid ligase
MCIRDRVEQVIAEVDGVQEACVIGVEDELLGEAIEAFVVPVPGSGLQAATVQQHCRENLESHKLPRAVYLRATLPRNSSGKILKHQLLTGR